MDHGCWGATSACTGGSTRPVRIFPGIRQKHLCAACIQSLRAMGLGVEDRRPEWVRRAEDRRLPAKVLR